MRTPSNWVIVAVAESLQCLLAHETPPNRGGIFRVTINDQVPRAAEHSCLRICQVARHLQHPRLIRVRCDAGYDDAPCGQIDHKENVVCDQTPPTPCAAPYFIILSRFIIVPRRVLYFWLAHWASADVSRYGSGELRGETLFLMQL